MRPFLVVFLLCACSAGESTRPTHGTDAGGGIGGTGGEAGNGGTGGADPCADVVGTECQEVVWEPSLGRCRLVGKEAGTYCEEPTPPCNAAGMCNGNGGCVCNPKP